MPQTRNEVVDLKVFRFLTTPVLGTLRPCVYFVRLLQQLENNPPDLSLCGRFSLNCSTTVDAGIAGLVVRGAEKVAQQAPSVWALVVRVLFFFCR